MVPVEAKQLITKVPPTVAVSLLTSMGSTVSVEVPKDGPMSPKSVAHALQDV